MIQQILLLEEFKLGLITKKEYLADRKKIDEMFKKAKLNPLEIVPTASTTLTLAIGDALAAVLMTRRLGRV